MTYLYYKSSTYSGTPKVNEQTINQWKHLSDKKNWRITQLPNGFYQTEVSDPADIDYAGDGPLSPNWHDVTREKLWTEQKQLLMVVLNISLKS